ncbi:DNA mismatch repair protein MutS [Candidatus Epulonipiscioides saccharophilum]|nr:DNA mismatch repair protein MutS [Epulopiscium sp. SCG-B10WGA-EpuloB]
MMKQYFELKKEYKDCILFFRLGDFYEVFFEDANIAQKELDLTLTKRHAGEDSPPMCGVPHHSAQVYINRLSEKGYKIAICEQMEVANSNSKGIVKRKVVRIVTPGTNLESLNDQYIASVTKMDNCYALSFCNTSACQWKVTQLENNEKKVIDEIAKYMPVECLINSQVQGTKVEKFLIQECNSLLQLDPDEKNTVNDSLTALEKHFGHKLPLHSDILVVCAYALLRYLIQTSGTILEHLQTIEFYNINHYVYMGIETVRSLELIETMKDKAKKGSLFNILDNTITPMGKRELKNWILKPLIDKQHILRRQDAVTNLTQDMFLYKDLFNNVKYISDLEKFMAKIGYRTCLPKDLITFKESIFYLTNIKSLLQYGSSQEIYNMSQNLDTLEDIQHLINNSIEDDPATNITNGGIIKKTYNKTVNELRSLQENSQEALKNIEDHERERTGIKNLKIKYNRVFGYFIEITNANKNLVPDNYIRKQTLSNCERYVTEELKNLEEKILHAKEQLNNLEQALYLEIIDKIAKNTARVIETSRQMAKLDAYMSLALLARENNYVCPTFIEDGEINILEGKHPVAENIIGSELFIANDTHLGHEDSQILLITGPNMGGKSTYMKQVALITLMAQIGSYVPAKEAQITIVDKIFTRIGASDDLVTGKSTFMVEMNEVANILTGATSDSLLILDEIGRGTSTLDGLSIAQAIIEYVSTSKIAAKTLFSTHYHELPKLVSNRGNIKNYKATIQQTKDDLIFLHKIEEGIAGKSFGIEVAKLAGLPTNVIYRANEILQKLDMKNRSMVNNMDDIEDVIDVINVVDTNGHEKFYPIVDSVEASNYKAMTEKLESIDIMDLTPRKAIETIEYFQSLLVND